VIEPRYREPRAAAPPSEPAPEFHAGDAAASAPAAAQAGPGTPAGGAAPRDPMLDQVVGNVLAQPVGPGTVADLALPERYVELVAERILQGSFAEHFRVVVTDRDPRAAKAAEAGATPAGPGAPSATASAAASGTTSAAAPAPARPAGPARDDGRPGLGPIGWLAIALALVAVALAARALRRGGRKAA
jgi:hypothetical protein